MQARVRCERSIARLRVLSRKLPGCNPSNLTKASRACRKKSGQTRDIKQYFLREARSRSSATSCKNEGLVLSAPLRADGTKTIRLSACGKCFAGNASVNPRG